CFLHIVNLACKAVLANITKISYDSEAREYDPPNSSNNGPSRALQRDPIVRASSLRRQHLASIQELLDQKGLQLLRDVDTRWSSTFLMIERFLLLREATEKFLEDEEFTDLQRFALTESDWATLEMFRSILEIPHAFQQIVSQEKTPTLSHVLPAFEAMTKKWEESSAAEAIDEGLAKLTSYQNHTDLTPAYCLAM
ncbi:hypothetical protein BC826DRAFT_894547, partial [Russula brevipes]